MKNKKIPGAGFVAAGWGVLAALFCSAERLMDSLGGWAMAFALIVVAYGLMRVGNRVNAYSNPSTTGCAGGPPPFNKGGFVED